MAYLCYSLLLFFPLIGVYICIMAQIASTSSLLQKKKKKKIVKSDPRSLVALKMFVFLMPREMQVLLPS